ncbi:MAG: hypothetical protein WBQ76_06625, partial [Candidatus Korobacteraceae bacterium]
MRSDGIMLPLSEPDLGLTILMPCLNEAETVGKRVQKAHSFLRRYDVSGEVLVSDNGSRDGSLEIAPTNPHPSPLSSFMFGTGD